MKGKIGSISTKYDADTDITTIKYLVTGDIPGKWIKRVITIEGTIPIDTVRKIVIENEEKYNNV